MQLLNLEELLLVYGTISVTKLEKSVSYAQLFGRDDQVTVKNPLNRDYIFQWDGRKYLLRASTEQPMAGWMAEHYVKEMTNLLMQQNGEQDSLMRESARQPYYKMLVVSHSRMVSVDSKDPDGDITVLGEEAVSGAPKKGLKLADASDDLVDKELDIDALPKDEDLYPAPKKKAKAKARADKEIEDLAPGELAASAAEELEEDDEDLPADPADGEEAFPDAPKA